MSFNGSGTYVPPAGQPVAAGTVIQSSTFNTLITDIGNTFNNVLPRDGQAAMAAQLKVIDGTSSMPGIAFNSEASTGIFRPMTGTLALVASGVEIMRINNAGRVLVGTTADDGVNRLQVNGGASFAGTVTGITKTMVGLGNVDNTSDANKPVSTTQQIALNLKANTSALAAVATSGLKADVGLGNVDNTSDVNKPVSTAATTALALKAPLASPAFTAAVALTAIAGAKAYIDCAGNAGTPGTNGMRYGQDEAGIGFVFNQANARLVFGTNALERMSVSAGGNVLMGTATDNGTDKLQVNGSAKFSGVVNTAATINCGATEAMRTTADSGFISFFNAANSARTGFIQFNATSTTVLNVDVAQAMAFQTAGTERMRIDASGNLQVGAIGGNYNRIVKAVAESNAILLVGGNNGTDVLFEAGNGTPYNTNASVIRASKNTATGRSFSGSGTVNASGADYAEYMSKAADCGDITKGQIVGVTAIGELTDRWLDAVSFMVKSSDPSYVGGDSWGTGLEGDELEAARAKVDRIAFAGQVPVNVMGAKPGQYIVPGRFGDSIGGIVMNLSDMNMQQYANAIGIVQNILADGRANVRVKVA